MRYTVSYFSVKMENSSPTHPSHFTDDLSLVRLNRLYAYLPDNGSPSRHPTYPAHSTTDSSSAAASDLLYRLVQGVGRFFNTRRMTPIVGSSDGPVTWHVAPLNESLEHPIQGNSTLCTHRLPLLMRRRQEVAEDRHNDRHAPRRHALGHI
jgi:hypothetical protein